MTTQIAQRRKKTTRKAAFRVGDMVPTELLVFCPSCKALEVMRFNGQAMIPTRKFHQELNRIYHSCGREVPCRLFKLT